MNAATRPPHLYFLLPVLCLALAGGAGVGNEQHRLPRVDVYIATYRLARFAASATTGADACLPLRHTCHAATFNTPL